MTRNLGKGSFAERVCYGAGRRAEVFDIGDFDGDRWLDWTVAETLHRAGDRVLFRNRGGGRFPGARTYRIG